MATPQTTYFGDVLTTGNTVMSGKLSVLGTSYFVSNLGTQNLSSIGQASTPFMSLYSANANVLTMNITSIEGNVGIGTVSGRGATLQVLGNLVGSNAVTATNVYVSLANATTLNGLSIFSQNSFLGIGTNVPSGTNLFVPGNVLSSNALHTPQVYTSALNVSASSNLTSLTVLSNVGIGTKPAQGGATLAVRGFAEVSNGITTQNVFAVTSVNTETLNTTSIFTNFLGVGTSVPSGTAVYVLGNVVVSNSVTSQSVSTVNSNVTAVSNVPVMTVRSNVGIGTAPRQGGATLAVEGNVFLSNSFTTPKVFAGTANISEISNVITIVDRDYLWIGPGAGGPNNVAVQGNVFVSNAVTATNVFGTVSANVQTLNVSSMSGFIGVGILNPTATLQIEGNVYASTSVATANAVVETLNVSAVSNLMSLTVVTNVGIGTGTSGNTLGVQGNVFASNAVTTANVFGTVSANVQTLNVSAMFGPVGFIGIGTTDASGTALYVQGNVYASRSVATANAVVETLNVSAVSNLMSLTVVTNVGIGTGTSGNTLGVQGNVFVSNAVTTTNVFGSVSANVQTLNVSSVSGFVGVGTTTNSGTSVYLLGNAYVSNAFSTDEIWTTVSSNTRTMNAVNPVLVLTNTGVGTGPTGNALEVSGNVFVSNAIATTNVTAARMNITSLNTLSIDTISIGATGAKVTVRGNIASSVSITTSNASAMYANVSGRANIRSLTILQNLGIGAVPGRDVVPTYSWTFDGTTTSTSGLTGAVSGTASYNPSGKYGSSLIMNGSSYVKYTTTLGYNLGTRGASFSMWFKLLAAPFGSSFRLFGATGSANTDQIEIFVETTRYINVRFFGAPGVIRSSIPLVVGTWTHLSFTFLGGTMVMYIDGVRDDSRNDAPMSGVILQTQFSIAALAAGSALNINGEYDDFRIYDQVLSDSQAFFVYNQQGVVAPVLGTAALSVQGNLVVSNTISVVNNVLATRANVTRVTNTENFGRIDQLNIGIGGAPGTTNLYVTGNAYIQTSFETRNVYALSVNTTSLNVLSLSNIVGIGAGPSGTSLYVSGNAYVSNSINVPSLTVSASLDALILNTASFSAEVLFANTLGWSNSNIYISNSITTPNLFTTNVTAPGYYGAGGTLAFGSGAQVSGNLFVAGSSLTSTNIVASTDLYYSEDGTKRSPHLRPSPGNASAIVDWISATCNAASKPSLGWWSESPAPVFGNIAAGPQGLTQYSGEVFLPDGRLLFVPHSASSVGFFNPKNNQFSSVVVPGLGNNFTGGVLLPNGNVALCGANIGIFDPVTYSYSFVQIGSTGLGGGVLDPNGNVFIPGTGSGLNANCLTFNPTTRGYSNILTRTNGFFGAVVHPSGNIICIPHGTFSNVGQFNPNGLTFSNIPGTVFEYGINNKFRGGVLTPQGNVLFVPYSCANAVVFNPVSPISWSNIPGAGPNATSGSLLPSGKVLIVSSNIQMIDPAVMTCSNLAPFDGFMGSAVVPDGRVVFTPHSSANVGVLETSTPVSREFCMCPYFNKF